MADGVELQREGDVAIVLLQRPHRRNALTFAMMRELVNAACALRRDRSLRAVILAGAGEGFCAGLDVDELGDARNRRFAFRQLLTPGQSLFQRTCLAWRRLPVPVIAAVHGACVGGGLQLALAADIRIATPDSRWSIMEARWGLVADMGISHTLRGLVRPDVAKELACSARVIDGRQAHALGLVTHLSEHPLAAARALAAEFAARSPDAVLAAKRVVDAMHARPAWRGLWLERGWQLRLLLGRNSAVARRRAREPDAPWEPRQFR